MGDDENAFSEVTDATRGDFDGDPCLDRWAKPRRSISIGDFVDSSAEDKKTNRATGLFGTCRRSSLGSRRSIEPSENRIGSGEMIGATHDYPSPAQGLGFPGPSASGPSPARQTPRARLGGVSSVPRREARVGHEW